MNPVFLKPVLKYAGVKRSIMKELIQNFPTDFNNYFEPFVGGGSVVMELHNNGTLSNKNVYLSDIMQPLINLYSVIKQKPNALVQELSQSELYANTKESFVEKRLEFNQLKSNFVIPNTQLAALFMYLNKVGFNGMYRENSSGKYNIPFGKQKNPQICNTDMIHSLSMFLQNQNVHLRCDDYKWILDTISPGDFVYMDPPYYGTFTGYNQAPFGETEQIELKQFISVLSAKGCKVAVSNSNHDFITSLYSDLPNVRFEYINVKRVINSKADKRKDVHTELLILNY